MADFDFWLQLQGLILTTSSIIPKGRRLIFFICFGDREERTNWKRWRSSNGGHSNREEGRGGRSPVSPSSSSPQIKEGERIERLKKQTEVAWWWLSSTAVMARRMFRWWTVAAIGLRRAFLGAFGSSAATAREKGSTSTSVGIQGV